MSIFNFNCKIINQNVVINGSDVTDTSDKVWLVQNGQYLIDPKIDREQTWNFSLILSIFDFKCKILDQNATIKMLQTWIFNLRILCEKYLQHQQNLYHVFIDFKKAFDRVWHAALWATMRKYNISANLVRTIEQLYDKATSAVQMNGSIGEWFRTTVGVRQGCLLSPTLFNIFLERIMSDALEEHDGKVSIGGRNITNLRFADDIDALAEEEQELEALVESLDKTCTRYKMEISAEKTKLMTNSANGIQREIKVK